jgi:hypothetical protein
MAIWTNLSLVPLMAFRLVILLMTDLRECLTLRLTPLLSYAPCPRDVFECASDKEMEENIFVDEELQGFDGDEDEQLHPSTS